MDVLIVGLDGLEPSLVRQWKEDLPTLSKLINSGSVSLLRSSDPPLSSPAWQWMFTGKQGGKHGVFGFTRQKEESYERVPVNLDDVHAETLWEALDVEGISCGVVNVPETYPPAELKNGYMISGWPIPNRANPASPKSVIDDLQEDIDESYKVNATPMRPELKQFSSQQTYESLRDAIEHHERAFESLLRRHEQDVFFCVFSETDVAGHYLTWDEDMLHALYVRQDEAVATLLDTAPTDVDVIALSDHGHTAKGDLNFHVTEWLRDEGYLTTVSNVERRGNVTGQNLFRTIGVTQENAIRAKNALGIGDPRDILPQRVFDLAREMIPSSDEGEKRLDPEMIDWGQTAAFTGSEQNVVFLNTKPACPEGSLSLAEAEEVRDEIAKKLSNLTHPHRDEPLVTDLKTNEEIFEGPFTDHAPGIVFICDEMRCKAHTGLNDGEIFSDNQMGEHRPNGILATAGPSFADREEVSDRSILDVFPLVLGIAGGDIPENVDGSIPQDRLEGNLEPTFRESRDNSAGRSEYSEVESEEVKEQLKGLGYLE